MSSPGRQTADRHDVKDPEVPVRGQRAGRDPGNDVRGWSRRGRTYSCTSTLKQTTENTVTATGEDKDGQKATDTDSKTVKVLPGIQVVKSAAPAGPVAPGTEVTYTFAVSIPQGGNPLTGIDVKDPNASPRSAGGQDPGNDDAWLESGEVWTYSCTSTLKQTTENTVTATGEDKDGQKATDTDSKTVKVLPGIQVVKSAAPAGPVAPGTEVTYTFAVSIPQGSNPLTGIDVKDPKCQSAISGPVKDPGTGETWTYTCSATLEETTTNTVIATGKDEAGTVVDDQDEVTVKVPKPGMKVVKTASASSVTVGESVTYTYEVSNTGDTELLNVKVTDDKCAPVDYTSGDADNNGKLGLKEVWTFTCTTTLQVTTENTALATGRDNTGQEVTATDSKTVTVTQVSPVAAKRICPITVTLVKPKPTKVGNRVIVKKIKTNSSCGKAQARRAVPAAGQQRRR
ncbi:MAG: hypothetical protein IPN52_14355 [Micrococcales bacterium]|nr:hypothetical protein [Micrococcales bacterium]